MREFRDALLSPKLVVKDSEHGPVHIAAVPIFVDEIIVRWEGRVVETSRLEEVPRELRSLAFPLDDKTHLVPFELDESQLFDRSAHPNTGFQGPRTLIAIRPIKVGEVITYDPTQRDGLTQSSRPE